MSESVIARHHPAGPQMGHHFASPDDNLTHIERLNPVADGVSPSDGTGAAGVLWSDALVAVVAKILNPVEPEPAAEPAQIEADPSVD